MRCPKVMLPLFLIAACGGTTNAPTVSSTVPASAGTAIAINLPITATFNRAMDPATLNASTFLLKQGSLAVPGAVTYSGTTAMLTPTSALAPNAAFTATVTVGSKDMAGMALASDFSWTFTTVATGAPPDVSVTSPLDAATNVWSGQQISATFNEEMDPTTLTTTTFALLQGSVVVPGQVSYAAATNTATFAPTAPLGASLSYSATLSTGAKNVAGLPLAAAHSWSFSTRPAGMAGHPVSLGTAGNYVILAETKISTVPTSVVTGDLGISPNGAGSITGFSLTADSSNTFSTSAQVTGKVYAADNTAPTSTNLTTAITDMGTAFSDAAGRAPDVTELGAGNIGGMTLAPGVYKWGTGLLIPTDVQLVGGAMDVWIFDVAQDLTVSNGTKITLAGGALAKNVFWQVSGLASLGTTVQFEGIILSQTAITLQAGASVNGRLLAQSAVTINGSTIVEPTP
jgi:hypothetical protein